MKTESQAAAAVAAHLRACEEALLQRAVRKNRAQAGQFLAQDFQEFGASGRVWNRDEILDELSKEPLATITLENFQCSLIADTVALVTYCAVRDPSNAAPRITSLRSSIWTKKDAEWTLRFHQGTRIP